MNAFPIQLKWPVRRHEGRREHIPKKATKKIKIAKSNLNKKYWETRGRKATKSSRKILNGSNEWSGTYNVSEWESLHILKVSDCNKPIDKYNAVTIKIPMGPIFRTAQNDSQVPLGELKKNSREILRKKDNEEALPHHKTQHKAVITVSVVLGQGDKNQLNKRESPE